MLYGSDKKKLTNDRTMLPTPFGWECYYEAYAMFSKPFIYIVLFLLPEYGNPGTRERMWEQWLRKVHSLIFSKINLIFATLGLSSTKAYKNGYIILEADNILHPFEALCHWIYR